jgi:hypothetical protein
MKPIISLNLWDEEFGWHTSLKMGVTQVALYANKGAVDHTFEHYKYILYLDILFTLMKGDGLCRKCGYFEKDITFQAHQPDDVTGLSLTFDKAEKSHLASFSKTVDWFLQKQWRHGCWRQ